MQYPENRPVILSHQFNHVRQSTIFPVLINPQEPHQHIYVAFGGHREEILPFDSILVDVQHYDLCYFRGVRWVCKVFRRQRVAPVAVSRVIEINDMEFRPDIIAAYIGFQFIVCNHCQVREFIVIDKHGIPFLGHLPDHRIIY